MIAVSTVGWVAIGVAVVLALYAWIWCWLITAGNADRDMGAK